MTELLLKIQILTGGFSDPVVRDFVKMLLIFLPVVVVLNLLSWLGSMIASK